MTPGRQARGARGIRADNRCAAPRTAPARQVYNAQTAVNDRLIILAAEIIVDAGDFGHLEPMLVLECDSPR